MTIHICRVNACHGRVDRTSLPYCLACDAKWESNGWRRAYLVAQLACVRAWLRESFESGLYERPADALAAARAAYAAKEKAS